jgi:hypothetical protein
MPASPGLGTYKPAAKVASTDDPGLAGPDCPIVGGKSELRGGLRFLRATSETVPGKFHENAEFEIDYAVKIISVAAYYAVDVNARVSSLGASLRQK